MNIVTSKSDEEFEIQHRNWKQKALAALKSHHDNCSVPIHTQNHLTHWYKHVDQRKKFIMQLRGKTKNRKCTLLERDHDMEEKKRKTDMLTRARQGKCASIPTEHHSIPKFINENELFTKSCKKKVHRDCVENYFKEQLKANNALHLQNRSKYPHIDDLIVIGKKIEPPSCGNPTSCECEEILEEICEEVGEELSECQFPVIFCKKADSSKSTKSVYKPKLFCEHPMEEFFKKSIAVCAVSSILNSIVNDIFKQNIYFLKMKFGSLTVATDKDEHSEYSNISLPSILSDVSNQNKTLNQSSEKCSFVRDADYMLTYNQDKLKSRHYCDKYFKKDYMKTKQETNIACLGSFVKSKKGNDIKTYWLNMFLTMYDKVYEIGKHVMITNGRLSKDFGADDSIRSRSSFTKSKTSRVNKTSSTKKSSLIDPVKASKKSSAMLKIEQQIQDQIRSSPHFQSMLYTQFRFLIVDAMDYVIEVMDTTY